MSYLDAIGPGNGGCNPAAGACGPPSTGERCTLADDLLARVQVCCHRRPDLSEIQDALAVTIPGRTGIAGMPLGFLVDESVDVDEARAWIGWALRRRPGSWPPSFARAIEIVAAEFFPEVWAAVQREAA